MADTLAEQRFEGAARHKTSMTIPKTMTDRRLSLTDSFAFELTIRLALLHIIFVVIALAQAGAQTQFQIVHSFGAPGDGEALWSGVAVDAGGNAFGTAAGGGVYGLGIVYELSPGGDSWTETVLYDFGAAGPNDGSYPYGPVTAGPGGVLYGATSAGGSHGFGTAYSLNQGAAGWAETIIHDFSVRDGVGDLAGNLVLDSSGNLFGQAGAFELAPGGSGWSFSLICELRLICSRNINDNTALAPGDQLFAAGRTSGKYEVGDVYAVVPTASGWQVGDLYDFRPTGGDGQIPGFGPLVADSAGNIYGVTNQGGENYCVEAGCGTIYQLTHQQNGTWRETILYNFQVPSAGTGFNPIGGVILDSAGNLYGTASNGGGACGCGVVYRLSHNRNNVWTYTVLHTFSGIDGLLPYSALTFDAQGNLFGTTVLGGPYNAGVVFEISKAAAQ